MALVDLMGKRFGRWLVECICEDSGRVKFWRCVCDCGEKRRIVGGSLKNGTSKSCGCLQKELISERSRKHGLSDHPAYLSWLSMKARCENPSHIGFPLYGGRGIKVCERWQSLDTFWLDMRSTWEIGLSLDRIDVNGNYDPLNCRWATIAQQANNKRNTRIIDTPRGAMSIAQASREFGIKRGALDGRIARGVPQKHLFDKTRLQTSRAKMLTTSPT